MRSWCSVALLFLVLGKRLPPAVLSSAACPGDARARAARRFPRLRARQLVLAWPQPAEAFNVSALTSSLLSRTPRDRRGRFSSPRGSPPWNGVSANADAVMRALSIPYAWFAVGSASTLEESEPTSWDEVVALLSDEEQKEVRSFALLASVKSQRSHVL
jgi:hypothetical protein